MPKEYLTQFILYLDALTASGVVVDRWDGSEHPDVWRFYDPAGKLVARCVPSTVVPDPELVGDGGGV